MPDADSELLSDFVDGAIMARPVSATLTDGELRLMRVLWRRGASTTGVVVDELATEGIELAESSVRTVLGILRAKGYVSVDRGGRAHKYQAAVAEHEARRGALRHLLSRFFGDSREELVLTLIRDERTSGAELARIRRIIQDDG
jgi:predicted transcriptional regulator